jgi:hypothetical protein
METADANAPNKVEPRPTANRRPSSLNLLKKKFSFFLFFFGKNIGVSFIRAAIIMSPLLA